MKKFLDISKKPLIIGAIASVLYLIDALIGGLFVKGGSFMWVAFAFWTVFFGASVKDRVKALIGAVIGFFAGILMMLITNSFDLSIGKISISCLLGVFLVNCLVMYFEKGEKVWINSISGIFVGIMLTFSGLGVGLNPINSFKDGSTMFAIIITYAILGLICGFCSIFFNKNKETKTNNEQHQNEQAIDNKSNKDK